MPNHLKSSNHPFWLFLPPWEARPALELHCVLSSPSFRTESPARVTTPQLRGDSGQLLPEHMRCPAKLREEAGWPLRWQPRSFWGTRLSPSCKLHPVCSQTGPTTRPYLLKANLPQYVLEQRGVGEGRDTIGKRIFEELKPSLSKFHNTQSSKSFLLFFTDILF